MKKLVALMLCLGLLAGCVTLSAAAEDVVTLRFSWWGGEERLTATLAVIEQFEALHPNIKITPEYGSSDGYNDRLATQLAGNTAPDIIQIDPGIFPSYVSDETNYFINYNDYDFDFSKFELNYLHQRLNGYFGDKQLGLPTGIAGCAAIVNKDLADKIGIDMTTQYTWEDVFTWGKKVREYDSSMYLINCNKTLLANVVLNYYLKQQTGKPFCDPQAGVVNYTPEVLENGYAMIKRLYDEEIVAPASYSAAYDGDNLQSDPNWIDGKYVCTISYSSIADILAAANPNAVHVAGCLPITPDSEFTAWNSNCPQVIAINSRSEHIAEALQFVDYFFNDETAMATLGCVRSVPPTARARELATENGKMSALLKGCADVCGTYVSIVDDTVYGSNEGKQIVIDQLEAVAYGVSTPAQAAAETISMLESLLAAGK